MKHIILVQAVLIIASAHAYRPIGYENISATANSKYADFQPATRVIDESGLVGDLHDNNGGGGGMWLTEHLAPSSSYKSETETGPAWIAFEFDKAYDLSWLWVWNYNQDSSGWDAWKRGIKDVSIEYSADGDTWQKLGNFTFNVAPGTAGYAHNTEINLGGIRAKYLVITAHSSGGSWGDGTIGYGLSEVRFFAEMPFAIEQSPIHNARGVCPNVTLSWQEGEYIAAGNGNAVYLGDDYSAVRNADINDTSGIFKGLQTENTYTPGNLDDGKKYYWRIDQHNDTFAGSPWKGEVQSFTVGLPQFRFDGSISRESLESYLARAITQGDICRPGNAETFKENQRLLRNTGMKFICRAAIAWDVPHSPDDYNMADDDHFYDTIAKYAAKLHEEDHELILQGTIFETAYSAYSPETPERMGMGFSGAGVEQIPIPAWVFEEFDLPFESRNFSYEAMIYSNGLFRNHWLPGASVPDISRLEAKMWFYYRARRYIDAGFESLHFGQMNIMNANDPSNESWYEVLGRIREYASEHARRHFVWCDGHSGTGIIKNGELLLDAGTFPFRMQENCAVPYDTTLEFGYIDSMFGRSKGGITPSGWYCEALPYNVEFDNSGAENPGVCGGSSLYWPWGWDEISWLAHCSNDYRNYWLEYAFEWLRKNDSCGYVRYPGKTTISADPIDSDGDGTADIWSYQPNMPNADCPQGFGQEEMIKKLISRQYLKDIPGIRVNEFHSNDEHLLESMAENFDTMQTALSAGSAELTVDSIAYGTISCFADSTAGNAGGNGVGYPDDNNNFVYGDLDIKFNSSYEGGRTLKDITVLVANASDTRRFYDMTFSYSTTDDPDNFIPFARAYELDEQALPSGCGTAIEVSDDGTGCVSDVDTLRISAAVAREHWEGSNLHFATALTEIDVNMYKRADIDHNGSINLADFSLLMEQWQISTEGMILNDSFELPDIQDGSATSITPTHWNKAGNIMHRDTSAAQWQNIYDPGQTVPDGQQIVSLNAGTLSQVTGEFIETDNIYRLSAFIGMRLSTTSSSAQMKLAAFDGIEETELATLNIQNDLYSKNHSFFAGEFLAPPLKQGKWVLQSFEWDSSKYPELAGQELRIYIEGVSVDIDAVCLTKSKSPADIDNDGVAGLTDLNSIAEQWLK